MSEILARLRVRETAGIRRFLYPLSADIKLPSGIDPQMVSLLDRNNSPLPLQIIQPEDAPHWLDFAISLAPYEGQELRLMERGPQALLDDPLCVELANEKVLLWSKQRQFTIGIRHDALHRDVVYDGVYFPIDIPTITCNGRGMEVLEYQYSPPHRASLSAWVSADGRYPDGRAAATFTNITAVKSWEKILHEVDYVRSGDEISFTLPLAVTAPTLTCDFGVGGYVFGKIDAKATEIVWRTEFGDTPYARWSVATAGRADYIGEVETAEAFLPQRWFHLIDSDKALAVAVTAMPPECREMTVRLTHEGDVSVAFRLGETTSSPAAFGVCYHFLNDIPAIAAATSPQSILLPPVVDVLPG